MTVIAHAGHWTTTVAYMIPLAAFLVWLIVTQQRERGRADEGNEEPRTVAPQDSDRDGGE